jgi:hypothetical protein
MADISTKIIATLTPALKLLSFDTRLAVNEKRGIEIRPTGTDTFPAATYTLELMYDWNVLAEVTLTRETAGHLTGTLDMTDKTMTDLFAVLRQDRINVHVMLWGVSSTAEVLWAADRVDVWRNRIEV